tara:strand:+ start:217 stop:756 length:540 start_codon:yes stop_codon:yes gene_type:complete
MRDILNKLDKMLIEKYDSDIDDLNEVSRAESNKVNAQLSKVLGNINFTHIYNQKGGMFKLPPNVKHEVTVDSNDMKDAADLLMKDDGDIGFMFKQGQIRLVPAMQKESTVKENPEFNDMNRVLIQIDNLHSQLERKITDLVNVNNGDLTDQIITMDELMEKFNAVIKRSFAIVPVESKE